MPLPKFKLATFPAALTYWREKRGMTQEQLAQALGLTQGSISKLEKGLTGPSLALGFELARVLKIRVEKFSEEIPNSIDSHSE